jgi:hypothetical protein
MHPSFWLKSYVLFIFVGIIQMHPGGSSFTFAPFINSYARRFLILYWRRFLGQVPLILVCLLLLLVLLCFLYPTFWFLCVFLLFTYSFCLYFAFSRPLHGLFWQWISCWVAVSTCWYPLWWGWSACLTPLDSLFHPFILTVSNFQSYWYTCSSAVFCWSSYLWLWFWGWIVSGSAFW